jgi:hypothetical protein
VRSSFELNSQPLHIHMYSQLVVSVSLFASYNSILECIDSALTIAAALSHSKPCFPSRQNYYCKPNEWEGALDGRNRLVESGFGGRSWRGGTVRGDLIAVVAAYNEWIKKKNAKERAIFCSTTALDNVAMKDIHELRQMFKECLVDAGFLTRGVDCCNQAKDDAILTSCCLVAGLYPNIATLMRPRKGNGNSRGGKLLTKDGDICRPSSSSFQMERVRNAAEEGKDTYAVFHSKHRSLGANNSSGEVFLSEVNFVSRFALLLFGGNLEVHNNALIVDGWLKFKVGDKGTASALLIQELRTELDNVMLRHIMSKEGDKELEHECGQVMELVRKILAEE